VDVEPATAAEGAPAVAEVADLERGRPLAMRLSHGCRQPGSHCRPRVRYQRSNAASPLPLWASLRRGWFSAGMRTMSVEVTSTQPSVTRHAYGAQPAALGAPHCRANERRHPHRAPDRCPSSSPLRLPEPRCPSHGTSLPTEQPPGPRRGLTCFPTNRHTRWHLPSTTCSPRGPAGRPRPAGGVPRSATGGQSVSSARSGPDPQDDRPAGHLDPSLARPEPCHQRTSSRQSRGCATSPPCARSARARAVALLARLAVHDGWRMIR
jgi:hypothetical protein